MTLFVALRRATLLIPSGPSNDPHRKHLFVLLTDPVQIPGEADAEVLLVGVASARPGLPHDPTCLLYAGDHHFLKHNSYVNYQRARLEGKRALEEGARSCVLEPAGMMEPGVFARVCKGLFESRFTVPRLLTFYRAATGES